MLTPQEVVEFFGIIRSLREAGKALVFITHKLGEVLEVADRISVLRGGKIVGEGDPKTATSADLAEMMVGRPVRFAIEKRTTKPGEPLLEVQGAHRAQRARRDRGPTASTSRCARAKSSASPASRATARPSWSRR